jgi:hypothetical protein
MSSACLISVVYFTPYSLHVQRIFSTLQGSDILQYAKVSIATTAACKQAYSDTSVSTIMFDNIHKAMNTAGSLI